MALLTTTIKQNLSKFLEDNNDNLSKYTDRILLETSLNNIEKSESENIDFTMDKHYLIVIKNILKCFKIYDDFLNIQNVHLLNYLNKVNYFTINFNKILKYDDKIINDKFELLNKEKTDLFNNLSSLGLKFNNISLFTNHQNDSDTILKLIKFHVIKELFKNLSIDFEDDKLFINHNEYNLEYIQNILSKKVQLTATKKGNFEEDKPFMNNDSEYMENSLSKIENVEPINTKKRKISSNDTPPKKVNNR